MATIQAILAVNGSGLLILPSAITVLHAAKAMAEVNVGAVIAENDDEVLGIFTERDLLRRVVALDRDPSTVLLQEVISSPLKSCHSQDDLRTCAEILVKSHIRHLAVIQDGTLMGLVSLHDILVTELQHSQEKLQSIQNRNQLTNLQAPVVSERLQP